MKKLLFLFLPLFAFSQITIGGQQATYANPYPQPIKIQIQENPQQAWNKAFQSNSNLFRNLSASGAFRTARQKAEDIISLGDKSINRYKYIVVANILASKEKEIPKIRQVINEELGKTNFKIIHNLNKIPDDLVSNPDLALYLYINSENENWPFKNVVLTILDFEGGIIHQRGVRHDRTASFLTGLVLESIKRHPHKFDINASKNQKKEDADIDKASAVEELKNLKELLELDLITKEEFDKKSIELKKIILSK